jgi:hypothetical protein
MFNKKIDRELESIRRHLDQVENEIKHEIKQLKCEHKNLEFLTEATYPIMIVVKYLKYMIPMKSISLIS